MLVSWREKKWENGIPSGRNSIHSFTHSCVPLVIISTSLGTEGNDTIPVFMNWKSTRGDIKIVK